MKSVAIRKDEWTPTIMRSIERDSQGISELAAAIAQYHKFQQRAGLVTKKRAESWRERLLEMLRESLMERLLRDHLNDGQLGDYAAQVAEHKRDPYALVEEIVKRSSSSREEGK